MNRWMRFVDWILLVGVLVLLTITLVVYVRAQALKTPPQATSVPTLAIKKADSPSAALAKTNTSAPSIEPSEAWVPTKQQTETPLPVSDPVLVGAGDIARCDKSGDEETADLIENIPGTVFTAGDNAYDNGSRKDFADCYDPTWGRFKDRTKPSPGNHEYMTKAAKGYFDYFGKAAGNPKKGYYSYDLGSWHIIALNSNIDVSVGSDQEKWLRQDLAEHPSICTLAYWHDPLFSSGSVHGPSPYIKPLWQALYDYHVDVVVNGHEHFYERYAPQTPDGEADSTGIREFIVGTGGGPLYDFGNFSENSEVRYNNSYGVIKFTLHASSYDWEFIPTVGDFKDSGNAECIE